MLVLVITVLRLTARPGSWNPAGADLEYPRTLLRAAALPDVRASLVAPDRLAIYQTLWADVQAAPPGDNATTGGRRARATYAKNAAFVVQAEPGTGFGRHGGATGGPARRAGGHTSGAFCYAFDHKGADMNQNYDCDEVSSHFDRVDYMFCEANAQPWKTAHWYRTVAVLGCTGSELQFEDNCRNHALVDPDADQNLVADAAAMLTWYPAR